MIDKYTLIHHDNMLTDCSPSTKHQHHHRHCHHDCQQVKADVEKDLPKKTETKVYVGMSAMQKEWYVRVLAKDVSSLNALGGPDRT